MRDVQIVDRGSGPPLVLVPGVQGRWEWFEAALDALAASFRVITCSYRDEPSSGWPRLARPATIDDYATQVRDALDARGVGAAVICGISFGGLVALRFAATHPARTSALVLASTPGPTWRLGPARAFLVRHPRMCAPLFFAAAPFRLAAEVRAAMPRAVDILGLAARHLALLARAPISPTRLAARAALIEGANIPDVCGRVSAPTLVLTGEQELDRVVPVPGSTEYVDRVRGAVRDTLDRTGHLGYVTHPNVFADRIRTFYERATASRPVTHDAA